MGTDEKEKGVMRMNELKQYLKDRIAYHQRLANIGSTAQQCISVVAYEELENIRKMLEKERELEVVFRLPKWSKMFEMVSSVCQYKNDKYCNRNHNVPVCCCAGDCPVLNVYRPLEDPEKDCDCYTCPDCGTILTPFESNDYYCKKCMKKDQEPEG